MTIGAILTQGFGTFGTVNLLPTLGYGVSSIPPTPPAVVHNSGGWFDVPTGRRKTAAGRRKEREEWGILPKKAKALIIRVAAQQVEEPDDSISLIAAFERAELAYKAQYAELFRTEVERQMAQMREDEELFILLH